MEKHSFEKYEFLPTTPTDSDTNQFFVLQDDGTILTVNKEIQYITEVEQVKDAMGDGHPTNECATVFDVSSQQYYVDVEGNAPEMISMNDQFSITNGENYGNSYLIQPEASSTSQQMEEEEPIIDPEKLDSEQIHLLNGEEYNGTSQTNNLTEITLSDEQYQILEKKGWLLLESNDRIFVLNTLGLHDITTNDKLIQKLKNELENASDMKTNIGQLKIESVTSELIPNESIERTAQKQCEVVELFIEKNIPIETVEPADSTQYIINENGEEFNEQNKLSDTKSFVEVEIPAATSKPNTDKVNENQKRCESIKIKTKYTFKDIPNKIFLGKTVNGKNLYAKVLKKSNKVKTNNTEGIIYGKKIDKIHDTSCLDGPRFTNIIQDSFRDATKLSPLSITYASAIVSQLLRLSDVNGSIVGSNLVVTKLTSCETDNGHEISQPTMVTGRVNVVDGEETFVHVPLLLHQLLDESEDKSLGKENSLFESPEEKTARDVIDLFHIHVSETRYLDKPPETSINFSKRKLPLDVLNDAKKRHPNPVYACGTCGAVFKSECLLKDHQNDQCIEVDDELTIDTDDFNTDKEVLYTVIIENGKEKVYTCTICETKFTRLFNCQKHIKAHQTGIEKKLKTYKCKMCPKSFFHSCTLSKHIVKDHIQVVKSQSKKQ